MDITNELWKGEIQDKEKLIKIVKEIELFDVRDYYLALEAEVVKEGMKATKCMIRNRTILDPRQTVWLLATRISKS
jgi:hypothetical protein